MYLQIKIKYYFKMYINFTFFRFFIYLLNINLEQPTNFIFVE